MNTTNDLTWVERQEELRKEEVEKGLPKYIELIQQESEVGCFHTCLHMVGEKTQQQLKEKFPYPPGNIETVMKMATFAEVTIVPVYPAEQWMDRRPGTYIVASSVAGPHGPVNHARVVQFDDKEVRVLDPLKDESEEHSKKDFYYREALILGTPVQAFEVILD